MMQIPQARIDPMVQVTEFPLGEAFDAEFHAYSDAREIVRRGSAFMTSNRYA